MLTEMFVKDHAEIIAIAAIVTACLLVSFFLLNLNYYVKLWLMSDFKKIVHFKNFFVKDILRQK